jgi:hypothetical protein
MRAWEKDLLGTRFPPDCGDSSGGSLPHGIGFLLLHLQTLNVALLILGLFPQIQLAVTDCKLRGIIQHLVFVFLTTHLQFRHAQLDGGILRLLRSHHLLEVTLGNLGDGSSLGLIVRPDALRAVGGYQRSEYPAADYLLNVRLAARFKFVRLRQVLALVRIEENVSAKRDVMLGCLRQGREIQRVLLADRMVPRWWDRLSGSFLRMTINEWNARWHVQMTSDEVGHHAGIAVPPRAGRLTKLAGLLMGAF